MSSPRLLCAGLWHETHTFVKGTTPRTAFRVRHGQELVAERGQPTSWGGVLETAAELGWTVEPVVDFSAPSSAIVEDNAFEQFWSDFLNHAGNLREEELDGLFLMLHGATATSKHRDAEGELLRRIREELSWRRVPIMVTLDLHANVTPLMARLANGLVAGRDYPHTDARETAERALRLLHGQIAKKETFRTSYRGTNIMWPPGGTTTDKSPMAALEAMARKTEAQDGGVLAVNICAGFAYADMKHTGLSFSVVHTAEATDRVKEVLERLHDKAWELRTEGSVHGAPVDQVLEQLNREPGGPFVLAEESDDLGFGAAGDGTGLLRALIGHQLWNAALCLADPEAVKALWSRPAGSRTKVALGGRGSRYDAGPLELEVTLKTKTDGHLQLEDAGGPLARQGGGVFEMGPTVLVEHRGILILLTTHRTPPMDLASWHSVGVDLGQVRLIGVKGATAHRRAYDPIVRASFLVDTPGVSPGDLRRLDYQQVRRPIFPLEA